MSKRTDEKNLSSKAVRIMHSDQIVEVREAMKRGRKASEEASLNKEIYFSDNYFSLAQFMSYYEQICMVRNLDKKDILEIGIGNGIVSDFLRKAGMNVTTFDINPNLNPDVVGSVLNLIEIFESRKFDLILCAEVLEHMPFECFERAIENISGATNQYAILTLPRCEKIILNVQLDIKMAKMPPIGKGLFLSMPSSEISPSHHWELDSGKETKLNRVNSILKKYFKILDFGRIRFTAYQRYFILKKT